MNKHSVIATSAAALLGFAAVLSLDLTPVRHAGAGSPKVELPCDKEGPFSPKVDKDLRRKDLVIEPAEMPRISEKRSRTPEQEREAERGVCQDGQTGKTITLPDPPPASRKSDLSWRRRRRFQPAARRQAAGRRSPTVHGGIRFRHR